MRVTGRIVRPGSVVTGHVEIDGPAIVEVVAADHDIEDFVVPGFVDLHCHGGGGHTFTTGSAESAAQAAAFHLAHGTTTMLASLVSSPPDVIQAAIEAFRPLVREGVLEGIHLEGPFLSAARAGAQNPAHLRQPDISDLREWLAGADAAEGSGGAGRDGTGNATGDHNASGRGGTRRGGDVKVVTIAPELDGAREAISLVDRAGAVAAVGHTDATYAQALDGVEAGATLATHLWNGMRPAHHREPGPAVALLSDQRVVCELIPDGVHLHDGMLRFAVQAAGPDRCALVTDAIAAAGMPDGGYELGGQAVTVKDGVARLTDGGSIAGSTLTMDAALRRAVAAGIPLAAACAMAATTPARVLGLADEAGAIVAGLRADLVVLSPDLRVKRVLRAGRWLPAGPATAPSPTGSGPAAERGPGRRTPRPPSR